MYYGENNLNLGKSFWRLLVAKVLKFVTMIGFLIRRNKTSTAVKYLAQKLKITIYQSREKLILCSKSWNQAFMFRISAIVPFGLC